MSDYRDPTHIGPGGGYPLDLIRPNIKELATFIRQKMYGKDVRESIARGLEQTSQQAGETEKLSKETQDQQAKLEGDFTKVIANATVDSEVILSRGGFEILPKRLDDSDKKLTSVIEESAKTKTRIGSPQNLDSSISKLINIGLTYACSTELVYGNDFTPYSDVVRKNDEGFYELDCSSYVLTILKGVTYENSRYFNDSNISRLWRYDMPTKGYQAHLGRYQRTLANHMGKWCYENGLSFEIAEDYSNLQPGDLIFFENNPNENFFRDIGHVGFWLGKTDGGNHLVLQCGNGPRNEELNGNPCGIHTYNDYRFSSQSKARMAARVPLQSGDYEPRLISYQNAIGQGYADVKLSEPLKDGKVYTVLIQTENYKQGTYPLIRVGDKNIFSFGSSAKPTADGWFRAVFATTGQIGDQVLESVRINTAGSDGTQKIIKRAIYEGHVSDYPLDWETRDNAKKYKIFKFSSSVNLNAGTFATVDFENRITLNIDRSKNFVVIDTFVKSKNDDAKYVILTRNGEHGTEITLYCPGSSNRKVEIVMNILAYELEAL